MKSIFKGKSIFFGTCFLIIILASCQKNDEIEINSDNLLLGVWTNETYDFKTETRTFDRVGSLPDKKYGISFQKNGKLIQRSSGWCGTPPLSFYNIEGDFSIEKDIVKVVIRDYPGNFQWKIISLNKNRLVIKTVLTEREKDYEKIMKLYKEIVKISISVSCKDVNDWAYTKYGAKACGGPQGYIAYSKKIDTILFLKKISDYSKLEDQYNKKWGIVSDCSLPPIPHGIECKNGYPVLKY